MIGFAAREFPGLAAHAQAAVGVWCPRAAAVLALSSLLALSVLALRAPIDYQAMGDAGYVGIFAITLLATSTFVLPVPYLAAIVVGGSFLDPPLVALVAGTAAALGELTGYLVGNRGRRLPPSSGWFTVLERGMARFGQPVIFVAAAVPNPVFDAVGLIAGATRIPLRQFLVACFLGKTIRFWIFATVGTSLLLS